MNACGSRFSFTRAYDAGYYQSPSPPCNFSFIGNYDADFYHSSSPPTPTSRHMSTCDQILESQRTMFSGVWVPPDERSPRGIEDHHLRACHALSVREIDDVRETEQNEMDSMMRKILECQQQFKEHFTARMDAISNDLNGRIEAVTTHVRILDTQISQISRVQTVASIDTNQGYRSAPSEVSETSTHDEAISTENNAASSTPTESDDRHTSESIDRHSGRAEPDLLEKAVSWDFINATIQSAAPQQKASPSSLPKHREKQRYTSSLPTSSPIINKTFRSSKTVLQLTKPRDSRRGLVSSFDDCAGKRSIPPIAKSHPLAVRKFFGRLHAPHAYKPPWMRRHLSKKHLLPPSEPPDT